MIPPPRTQQSEWLNHITMRRVDELRVNVWLIRLAVAATKEVRLRDFTCQTASDFRDRFSRLPWALSRRDSEEGWGGVAP